MQKDNAAKTSIQDYCDIRRELYKLNRRVHVLIATGAGTIAAVALFLLLVLL